MTFSWPRVRSLLTTTFREVGDDDVPTLAAAIAYYTVFSLPPLLVILVGVAGALLGPERVVEMLMAQAESAISADAAQSIQAMIENASTAGQGIGSKVMGLLALAFGATGAFAQLQKALNRAWEVEEAEGGNALRDLLLKRILSFGMVLTIAFLLLVSLAVSATLAALGSAVESVAGAGAVGVGVQILNTVVSFGVVAALFAVLFKYLPDAEVSWRDVAVGAVVTAFLFTIGKTLLSIYLSQADPGSAFGAAGSLALVLVWVYYSALIVLVGAEFTQAWALSVGGGIRDDARPEDDETVAHPVAVPRDPAPY